MKINWFPGHMRKALSEMEQSVKKTDFVLYVLDARAPLSCVNPRFAEIVGNKPIIYILNKYDLADEKKLSAWQSYFSKGNAACIGLNSTESGAAGKISKLVNMLCHEKLEKAKTKGFTTFLRGMVIGVPNSGKSTLVNNLCGAGRTQTGDKPGVTKCEQWVRVSPTIEILDTPGTLYPNLENQDSAKRLAFIGSIKDDILDKNELALELISELMLNYPAALQNRYNYGEVKANDELALAVLEQIAVSRKYMLKGNEIDYDRTCSAILDDFRKGKLGKITLEALDE